MFRSILTPPRLAQAAITTGNITDIIRSRSAIVEDSIHVFSDKVAIEVRYLDFGCRQHTLIF